MVSIADVQYCIYADIDRSWVCQKNIRVNTLKRRFTLIWNSRVWWQLQAYNSFSDLFSCGLLMDYIDIILSVPSYPLPLRKRNKKLYHIRSNITCKLPTMNSESTHIFYDFFGLPIVFSNKQFYRHFCLFLSQLKTSTSYFYVSFVALPEIRS